MQIRARMYKKWWLGMIANILFNDIYRPIVCSLISVLLVYSMRNDNNKMRTVFYSAYLIYVSAFFGGIFLFASLANESFSTQALFWGIKWICFFLIITIAQHFVYHFFGKGKDIRMLILNAVVVLILCRVAMYWIDKFPL